MTSITSSTELRVRNRTQPASVPPPIPARTHGGTVSNFKHYVTRPILNAGPILFAASVASVLVIAFKNSDDGYLTAESGIGYWLGIVGGVLMLLLLGYPLRKRLSSFSRLGRVAHWFKLHMVIGILGPALVVLHTNFKLGSLNSRLALFTMLIVVASGIAGRYLYAKVHRGLYGQHAALRDVLTDIAALKLGIEESLGTETSIVTTLEGVAPSQDRSGTVLSGVWSVLISGMRLRAARRHIMREARTILHHKRIPAMSRRKIARNIRQQLNIYFAAVKKAERLALFERIFGLWHHLHMPLFVLLTLSVTLHIIAVHRY